MSINYASLHLFQRYHDALESLGYASLLHISASSFNTFRKQCRGALSYSETRDLYLEAEHYSKQLQANTRKVLTHSNPQLKHVQRLAIEPLSQEMRDYETLFGRRADAYVPTSSVASMFSPAGYLTELYREGKQLHTSDKPQHLDKRRPDLQSLLLSQSNQDAEITTLALSNDILLSTIQTNVQETDTKIRESLDNRAYPFDLPYHIPFASIETALAVQNTRFEALAHALAPSQTVNSFPVATRAAYTNHLSPGLRDLLLAPIPHDEVQQNDMLLYHFGTADIEQLSNVEYFCQRVGINKDELNTFLSLPSLLQSNYVQENINVKVPLLQPPQIFGGRYLSANGSEWLGYHNGVISRIAVSAPNEITQRLNILPSVNDSCIKFAALSTIEDGVPSTYIDIEIDGEKLTAGFPDTFQDDQGVRSVPLHDGCRIFEFQVMKSSYKLRIGIGDENIYNIGGWYPSSRPTSDNFSVTISPIDAVSLIKLSQLVRYSQKTGLSPATLDSVIALSQGSNAPAITDDTLLLTARALEYQQRYALSEDDALVLAGADINAYAPAGELSQFDRLFNNPPLNDIAFTINNDNDTISFDPTDTTYTHERAVLARALGVDDAGLATLAVIVAHNDPAWPRSLANLSTLYRVGLWARVHSLSPPALQLLLQLNGKTEDVRGQIYVIYADYLDAVYSTSEWLAAQQLSVAELNVMTTQTYSDTMTPEIDSFVRTLYQAVKGGEVGGTFEVASVSSPTAVAGEDLVAEVLLTRAIHTSDAGVHAQLAVKIIAGSATSTDYDASAIQADYLDAGGNILKSQPDISVGSSWTLLEAMPVGTVLVRLTLPTTVDGDTTDEQLSIVVARQNHSGGSQTGIATITPVGTQTTRATRARSSLPRTTVLTPNPLHQLLAPHLAAAFGLDNVDSAVAQQVWIEQVAADQGLSLTSMSALLDAIIGYCEGDAPSVEESAQLATFSQALGQLAFIIKREKMSAAELNVVVDQPYILASSLLNKLSLSLETMQCLSGLKTLLLHVGESASECLTLLKRNQLNAATLARWLNVPESEVALAATCVGASENMMNASQAAFALDWLDQAATLGVSVQTVKDLLTSQLDQDYSAWQKVAGAVQAGVVDPVRGQMNVALDEALSTALCAYFINRVAPVLPSSIPMQNRDNLFRYLLIDNQVSGQITTSRIAEAISSVQLYINRSLQGLEVDIDNAQLTEAFFVQWQQYNKRYSTWAGVSQLAYYPENYIDPSLRYNQSGLQRQLLNELNQSQLNKDSVETAYLNYLDGFEDIANLKVLCGYHHGAILDKGMSYFVGRSTDTPALYYWRSLNHEASDGVGGYAASAWTDWEEISGKVSAVNDEVRPVLFNNRLYIASIIQQMVADGVTPDGEPVKKVQYSLQLTYRKINGNWAPAMSFVLSAIPDALFDDNHNEQPKFNLYLSYHPLRNAILFMLYDPSLASDYYDGIGNEGPAYGGFIYNNMQLIMVEDSTDDEDTDTVNEWAAIYSSFSNNLNNNSAPNKVIRYISAQEYSVNVTPSAAKNTADSDELVVSDIDVVPEVDNRPIPAELSYAVQGTIQTKDTSTEPTAIVTPGDISDQSGDSFEVITNEVTASRVANGFNYTTNVVIKTKEDTYKFDSKLAPYVEIGHGSDIGQILYFLTDIKYPDITITYIVNVIHKYVPRYRTIKVINLNSGEIIFSDETTDCKISETIQFSELNPPCRDDGLLAYGVIILCGNDTLIPDSSAFSLFITNYKPVPTTKELLIEFAGNKQNIPSGPAATHTIPALQHTIDFSEDGSPKTEPQYLRITAPSAQEAWTEKFTLGYTAYDLGRQFTYNWGEGDIALPVNDTTNIAEDYHYPIPSNGLHQTRTLTVKRDGLEVFRQSFQIDVTGDVVSDTNPTDNIQIIEGDNEASYLEKSNAPKRIRLNTLFARDLVNRARAGLDNVLSWETQQLPEPALGKGFYVDIVFAPYDPQIHGTKTWFKLYYSYFYTNKDQYLCFEGELSDTEQVTVRIFYPYPNNGWVQKTACHLEVEYQSGLQSASYGASMMFVYDTEENVATSARGALGVDSCEPDNSNPTEPMDFRGANGLYFWELFYYTPMLVAEKLLQSQDFEEAERWLNYVFNPAGYLEGKYPSRKHVDRQWNSRPLAEDTAWDDTQTDDTDPDVVAQADPMHYKVATFMKLLDILIARGDMAYRLLERDTLAEAKMWYLTALQLLGPQPDLPEQGGWDDPSLSMAASETTAQQRLMLMERLMLGDVHPLAVPAEQALGMIAQAEASGEDRPAQRTANSLTALFLPCENGKLNGYWQTLAQRLFNLRHNLSIDGQPLTLPLYAAPADPKALQNAAAAASAGGTSSLPNVSLSILRFPKILESARELVAQLTRYGNTLSSVLAHKDAEALEVMLQTHAQKLYGFGIQLIEQNLLALDEEQSIVKIELEQQNATMKRMGEYYDENISQAEKAAISLQTLASTLQYAKAGFELGSAGLKSIPNIFGLAIGGGDFSAFMDLGWKALDLQCNAGLITADVITTTEAWRRRREEWKAERDAAERQIRIGQARLRNIDIQKQAQQLQKAELEQQQANTQAHYNFLTTKFSNKALYSWMQGRLSALYYQFYDLSIARCLKAQLGYQWETGSSTTFIQPGAWDSNHAGLLCGESLMLNLAQMESAYLEWDARTLEVIRTVSMAQEMGLDSASFNGLVNGVLDGTGTMSVPSESSESSHSLTLDGEVFRASIDLKSLNIANDYPDSVVTRSRYRLIKQVSVSLPALLGPYQDIQAVLGYSVGGGSIHPSCMQTTISHGSNDSGQFRLDFNDSKYLPFEGLPVDGSDNASLTLSFPNAGDSGKQKVILQSLNDIVLHICYIMRDSPLSSGAPTRNG